MQRTGRDPDVFCALAPMLGISNEAHGQHRVILGEMQSRRAMRSGAGVLPLEPIDHASIERLLSLDSQRELKRQFLLRTFDRV